MLEIIKWGVESESLRILKCLKLLNAEWDLSIPLTFKMLVALNVHRFKNLERNSRRN